MYTFDDAMWRRREGATPAKRNDEANKQRKHSQDIIHSPYLPAAIPTAAKMNEKLIARQLEDGVEK